MQNQYQYRIKSGLGRSKKRKPKEQIVLFLIRKSSCIFEKLERSRTVESKRDEKKYINYKESLYSIAV